jgi:hypothetical protein
MRALIVILMMCVVGFSVNAQKQKGVKKEGAHQAEFNADGQQKDNDAQIESRNLKEPRAGKSSIPGQDSVNVNNAASASNTEGVDVMTTSPSGSPGIRANGGNPDGTNTMQRASLNIAGSPLPGKSKISEKPAKSSDRPDARVQEPLRDRKTSKK